MVNKILYCATVDYHFKSFHLPYMKWFKEQDWQVDVAASGNIHLPYTDNKYTIPIERSPFRRANIRAYKEVKKIIEQNKYSIIHCHTPLGGVLARLAARRARKKGTKVMYTAHGFHFFKGAPFVNWLSYYPMERYLSRHTDSLITINQEDYNLATNHRFQAKEIEHVPGVGVDTDRFKPVSQSKKAALKKSFGYKPDDFLLFNAGEFNENKNQQFLIHAMVHIINQVPNAKLLLAGEGALLSTCQQLAKKLGVSNQVAFLGFRKDIADMMPMCDAAVASSVREGLPVNIMEAMACGLPVVAVDNRGHRELVHNDLNGWIVAEWDSVKFANKVKTLTNGDLSSQFGWNGRKIIVAKYSTEKILEKKSRIYKMYMGEQEDVTWAIP